MEMLNSLATFDVEQTRLEVSNSTLHNLIDFSHDKAVILQMTSQ